MPFCCRFFAFVLKFDFLPFFDFFNTPESRCAAKTDGRSFLDSVGGLTFLSDLSVSIEGDEARFAARECTEVTEKLANPQRS